MKNARIPGETGLALDRKRRPPYTAGMMGVDPALAAEFEPIRDKEERLRPPDNPGYHAEYKPGP